MDLLYKRILYLFFGFIVLSCNSSNAGALKVERFSSPVKLANKISQPINLSFVAQGNWKLLVEALDSHIRNQDNPNYSIPITRLELAELGGNPIAYFDSGKVIEIKAGGTYGLNNLNLAINVISNDCDRPGNYAAEVKFTLIGDNAVSAEDIYSFRFKQEEIASIVFSNRVLNLSIDKNKILQKGSKQNLPIPLGLYISSNKNWKLYVRKTPDSKDAELSYSVKVLGGDQSINFNMTNEYIPMNENAILLASGKSTINEAMNCLDKKLINIDYQVKGPEDKFISSGSRSEDFEYRLETED